MGSREPQYPNARDCEHGQLRRSCERCADAAEIATLSSREQRLEAALRELYDAVFVGPLEAALRELYDAVFVGPVDDVLWSEVKAQVDAALGEQEATPPDDEYERIHNWVYEPAAAPQGEGEPEADGICAYCDLPMCPPHMRAACAAPQGGGTMSLDKVAPTEPTQEELLEDDLLRCMEVRNLALEEAALYVQPGPDGQDYLDRGRLIRMWVDAAHERHDEGERAADAHIGGFGPSPSLTQWAAAPQVAPEPPPARCGRCGALVGHLDGCPQVAPEPERCPTCESDERDKLGDVPYGGVTCLCDDPWHRPAPLVEEEQAYDPDLDVDPMHTEDFYNGDDQ